MRYYAIVNDAGQVELLREEFRYELKNTHRRVAVFNNREEMETYYEKYLGGGIDYSDYDGCTCDLTQYDEHTCPFKSEIHEDDSLCTCCPYHTQECSWDI